MRADLVQAYKEAGLAVPNASNLTRRVNQTYAVLEGIAKYPPEVRRDILRNAMGRPGFLAVPAAAAVGASQYDQQPRNALMPQY
jgi:hypothetical protein